MKKIQISTWMFLVFLSLNQAQAEIYKCTDQGKITFSSTPCPTKKQKCFLSDGKFGDECEAETARKLAEKQAKEGVSDESANLGYEEKLYTRTAPRDSYYSGTRSYSSSYSSSSQRVSGYTRSNGTHVNSYTRSSGGRRR